MGFSYEKALIGYAVSKEGYVVSVYSQELMIQEMGEIDGLSEEDALDWIGFNDMTVYRFDGPIVITSQCEQMLDEKLEPGIIGFLYDENFEPIPVFQEGKCSYDFWEPGPERLIVKLFKDSEKLVKDTILT